MKKGPDKLKGARDKKVPESGTRKLDGAKKSRESMSGKIQTGVRARVGRVIEEETTVTRRRKISEGAEVSVDKKRGKKKGAVLEKGMDKKHPKVGGKDTIAEGATSPMLADVEKIEPALPADFVRINKEIAALQSTLDPVPGSVPQTPLSAPAPAPVVPAEQPPSMFERNAREVYKPEELTEFESLGISLDTAGQYVFIQKHSDGSIRTLRKFSPQVVKLFIDAGIPGQKIVNYLYEFAVCRGWSVFAESIIEWEKNKLDMYFIERSYHRLKDVGSVKFYARYFAKHPEIKWEDIPFYPNQFTPKQVEWLVYAGVRPEDSLEQAELFGDSEKDLFTPKQMEELRQDKLPIEVKIAYNEKTGAKWEDSSLLIFAKSRLKPALVSAYGSSVAKIYDGDLVKFAQNFISPAELKKYAAIYEKSFGLSDSSYRTKYVISLVRHKTDPALALDVFAKYSNNGKRESRVALRALNNLVEAGVPLDQAIKYPVECCDHDYRHESDWHAENCVTGFIMAGVAPEKVEEFFAKIPKVQCSFACKCIAGGIKAEEAKPYRDADFDADSAVALWRGKVSAGTASPYKSLTYYYHSQYRNSDGSSSSYKERAVHNPSAEEIISYATKDVGPEVAALLRKADFTDEELASTQRQLQKAKTRSKIFTVAGGILAVAAVVGIGYKACHGCGDRKREKSDAQFTQALAQAKAQAAAKTLDTLAEQRAREDAKAKGIPFMTEREAYASGKLIRNANGEWVTMPGYKFVTTEELLNWAIVPREGSASSSEDLSVECHYNFTPTPDGKGKVKPDCTQLDNEKLIVKGVRGSLPDLKIADAVVTGTLNGHSYTCEETDFFMPEDRTRAQALDPLNRNIACKILDK